MDTELFTPNSGEKEEAERAHLREKLGFSASDIVCVYTGRFSEGKNPLLLAKAVGHFVQRGERFRALFVGNGVQAEAIQAIPGCAVHPFVPVDELAPLYRASDIGVWPAQESTSMLDAAACGLPIVANSSMSVSERLEGNGVAYRLNDLDDLLRALLSLRDPQVREKLGSAGAQKVLRKFSWESVARQRLRDYETVLQRTTRPGEQTIPKEQLLS